jgi:hypothetical protein
VWCGLGRGPCQPFLFLLAYFFFLPFFSFFCSGTSCHCSVSPTPVFPCAHALLFTAAYLGTTHLQANARGSLRSGRASGVGSTDRADRPVVETTTTTTWSIFDFVLRLKLVFTFFPSYLSLYIIAHLTVLHKRWCVSSAASPGPPPPRLSFLSSAYLLIILHGYDLSWSLELPSFVTKEALRFSKSPIILPRPVHLISKAHPSSSSAAASVHILIYSLSFCPRHSLRHYTLVDPQWKHKDLRYPCASLLQAWRTAHHHRSPQPARPCPPAPPSPTPPSAHQTRPTSRTRHL